MVVWIYMREKKTGLAFIVKNKDYLLSKVYRYYIIIVISQRRPMPNVKNKPTD